MHHRRRRILGEVLAPQARDAAQGRAETAWFRASRETLRVAVAGYTRHAGIRLWAEFRDAAGAVRRVDCTLTDPRETWAIWPLSRPAEAREVRIVAEDRTSAHTGWIAFSHPFRSWPPALEAAWHLAQLAATFALARIAGWSAHAIEQAGVDKLIRPDARYVGHAERHLP